MILKNEKEVLKKQKVVMVGYFVILSKAFDCVDTANLIEIIAALSVGAVVLQWILLTYIKMGNRYSLLNIKT